MSDSLIPTPVRAADDVNARREPDGPRGYPLIGILPKFAVSPLAFLLQQSRSHGEVFRLDLGSRQFYFINRRFPK